MIAKERILVVDPNWKRIWWWKWNQRILWFLCSVLHCRSILVQVQCKRSIVQMQHSAVEQGIFSQELRKLNENSGLKPKSEVERENPVIPHRIPPTFPPPPNSVTNTHLHCTPPPSHLQLKIVVWCYGAAEPILQDIPGWFPPNTGVHSYTAVHCRTDAEQVIFFQLILNV